MGHNERRSSHGTFKPNIYFLLQVIIICIIAFIIIQFNLGTGVTYIVVVISVMFTIHFFMKRNQIVNREVIEREIVDGKVIHRDD